MFDTVRAASVAEILAPLKMPDNAFIDFQRDTLTN